MLQDTLRSAVHTSLMKPAPVNKENGSHSVGYGTMMNIKNKHSKPTADAPPGGRTGEEDNGGDESGGRSHLQLFQASEGARELAQMIDSLSKAPSLDGRSKDIAKDLLRGARDLQSSLAMLAELQEASKSDVSCRSRAKGRHEEVGKQRKPGSFLGEHKKMPSKQRPEFLKQGMGAGEIMVCERLGSRKSRFSVDESSRYGAEEMKTMSRLKFKQRFEYVEEGIGVGMQKPRFSGRSSGELKRMSGFKLKQRSEHDVEEEAFCAEETVHSKRFGSPEPRLSVDSVEELRRVIKDGLSRQNLLPQSSGDEYPRSLRRPRFGERRGERKEKPKQAKGPNVIAKLMGLDEEDERRTRKKKGLVMPRPAFDIDDRPKARKTQAVEKPPDPAQKSLHEIIAAMQFKGLLKSGRGEGFERTIYKVGVPKSNGGSFNKEEERKLQAAETRPNPTQKSLHEIVAALQFKGLLKSGRGEDFKRTIYEVGVPKSNSGSFNEEEEDVPPIVIMKPLYLPHWGRGEMKSNEETSAQVSPMANALTTVAQKLQRKKASSKSGKRTDEGQKVLLDVKREEKDDMKKKIAQISASKNKILQMKPETKNSTSVAKEKKNSLAAKSIRKSTDTKTEDKHCEDGKRSNIQEGKDLFSKNSTSTVHDLTLGAYKQAKPYIQDGKQENLCEMMRKTTTTPPTTTTRVASEVEEDLMCLLLSSRSFINHAKELFLIDAHHQPVHYKRKGIGEDVMRNAKLYLDCGKELMARKSNQIVKKYSSCSSSAFPSLTQLAEEISSVIETLASYSQIDDNLTFEDDFYLRLERDLWSKDMMASANWDIGWEDWLCTEEASRVECVLEEFILGWLLTEVAQDLVCL